MRTLREETELRPGDRIVVGVSGGGDSMALLHVLAGLRSSLKCAIHAHGVDHGFRSEAVSELDLAEQLSTRLEVPFTRSSLQLSGGGNLQARAREGRYTELEATARRVGARWVATAHHHEDRAETLLIRLLRGTGPRGLAVLPACSTTAQPGRLRPLIRSSKAAIERHLTRHEIAYACDPSNRNPKFLRTRVRHELLPLLEELAEGATDRLNRLADEMTALREESPAPNEIKPLLLHLGPVHAAQVRRAQQLKQRDARVWLPGGLEARLDPLTGQPCVSKRVSEDKIQLAANHSVENAAPRGGNRIKSD